MMQLAQIGTEKVRVLIVDDQVLRRESLATRLAQYEDFDMIGGAVDGGQAIEFARRYRPDVMLIKLRLPRTDSIAAIQRILREFPHTNIVVLAAFEADDLIYDA